MKVDDAVYFVECVRPDSILDIEYDIDLRFVSEATIDRVRDPAPGCLDLASFNVVKTEARREMLLKIMTAANIDKLPSWYYTGVVGEDILPKTDKNFLIMQKRADEGNKWSLNVLRKIQNAADEQINNILIFEGLI